jgi:hypothetical protein
LKELATEKVKLATRAEATTEDDLDALMAEFGRRVEEARRRRRRRRRRGNEM